MHACTGGGAAACEVRSSVRTERALTPRLAVEPSPIPDLPLWYQFQQIGGNLSPQSVSNILREADTGYPQRLVDLFHELRQKDATLHSVMQTRELALGGCDWGCLPPETPAGKRKQRQAQDIADDCTAMVGATANFPELVAHLVGAGTGFGHSHSENMWTRDGSRLFIERFKNISPRRFVFDFDNGQLLFLDVASMGADIADGVDLVTEYPGKFVRYRPRVNGDVPIREGLARLLVWPALFRNWDLRDWLQLAEMAWKPRIVGTYKEGASQEDIVALKQAVSRFSSTGHLTISERVSIAIEWAKAAGTQNTSAHKELFDSMSAELAKAVLGQTLTTEQGAKGSQALGNVHDRVRADILDADARGVERAIREFVLRPYVELNYGATAPVPWFRFDTERATDTTALATSIQSLSAAGMRTIPESWVRDEFGIPEPQGDEPVVGQAAPQPGPAEAPAPGAQPPQT